MKTRFNGEGAVPKMRTSAPDWRREYETEEKG